MDVVVAERENDADHDNRIQTTQTAINVRKKVKLKRNRVKPILDGGMENVFFSKSDESVKTTMIQRSQGVLIDSIAIKNGLNVSLSVGPRFLCKICGFTFLNALKLKIHYLLAHKVLYCKICDLLLEDDAEKQVHDGKYHCVKDCEICHEVVVDPELLLIHYRKVHDAVMCDFCDVLLFPSSSYEEHMTNKHFTLLKFARRCRFDFILSNMRGNTFFCRVCEKQRHKDLVGHYVFHHKLNTYNLIEILIQQKVHEDVLLYVDDRCEDVWYAASKNGTCVGSCTDAKFHAVFCEGRSYCGCCDGLFENIESLDKHAYENHDRFVCKLGCATLSYNTHDNLKKHYVNQHKSFECVFCEALLPESSYETHLTDHKVSASYKFKQNLLETKENAAAASCCLCDCPLSIENSAEIYEHFKDLHGVCRRKIIELIGSRGRLRRKIKIEEESFDESDESDDKKKARGPKKEFRLEPNPKCICLRFDLVDLIGSDVMDETNCDFCSLKHNSNWDLACHLSDWHGFQTREQFSKCSTCKMKVFSLEEHLNHLSRSLEMDADEYCCTLCGVTVERSSNVREHILEEHPNDGDAFSIEKHGLKCRLCEAFFWTSNECEEHEISAHHQQHPEDFFKCFNCSLVFGTFRNLRKHGDCEEYAAISYQCTFCNVSFPDYPTIRRHFGEEHDENKVMLCPQTGCGKGFATRKYVLQHGRKMHPNMEERNASFECRACGKTFPCSKSMVSHRRQAHKKGFGCSLCKEKFVTLEERKMHYSVSHPGEVIYKCKLCGKGFHSKSGLHRHTKLHEDAVNTCQYCRKEFASRDSFKEHLLIHEGPKHQCPHCPKLFTQKSNLRRHVRLHTGAKPYSCPHCEKTFSDKGACNSHVAVHTREKDCFCDTCGKKFSKPAKLKYHIRIHTGEGLLYCELCGKQFTALYNLKEHRALHNRETQVLCICGKAFSKQKYLDRHMELIHNIKSLTNPNIKPFKCIICTKYYAHKQTIMKHLQKQHNLALDQCNDKIHFLTSSESETNNTYNQTDAHLETNQHTTDKTPCLTSSEPERNTVFIKTDVLLETNQNTVEFSHPKKEPTEPSILTTIIKKEEDNSLDFLTMTEQAKRSRKRNHPVKYIENN